MKKNINSKKVRNKMKIYWDEDYLREQITKGKTYLNIAGENGVSRTTVQRALNRYNLTNPSLDWTRKELKLLKKYYGKTTKFEKILPNRTPSSIYHKAHRLGLRSIFRYRKYKVNEGFFRKWTKEMVYVLGWMFSDGNMAPKKRTIRIKLSIRDKSILEKIRDVMGSNTPIKILNQPVPSKKFIAQYGLLSIHSRKICKDLLKLGCLPNKMRRFVPPSVPKSFLSHFVRGYFDGDGSISFNKPNTIRIRIVSSNKSVILWLVTVFDKQLKVPINYKQVSKSLWQCEYYGDNARKICHWMYVDCGTLYLERKKNRFVKHIRKRNQYVQTGYGG